MTKTTLKLSKETHERLKQRGKMGDSFDEVLNRLLDEIEHAMDTKLADEHDQ